MASLSQTAGISWRDMTPPEWDEADRAYAVRLRESLPEDVPGAGAEAVIRPFVAKDRKGSTDVGDVSRLVPTANVRTATWVPGTVPHSWQAVAAGGTDIGIKGMIVAAKTLALTAVDVFRDPSIAAAARAELDRRLGPDFRYEPLLGDRDPPLDYRR